MDIDQQRIKQRIRSALTGTAALVLIGLVFYLGARTERSGFVRDVLDPGFRRLSDPVLNAFRRSPPPVAHLDLTVDSLAADSLESLSERAWRDRRVTSVGNSGFEGTLVIGERQLAAMVALREGAALGGRQRTWPLHLRLAAGDTVLGMRTFDVVPIASAGSLWSMLLHVLLADQGQAALRSGVAEVSLNGTDLGPCALFERADASSLTRWSAGSGPVLRFEDDLLLNADAAMAQRILPSAPPPQSAWLAAPLLLNSLEDDRSKQRAQKGIQRMEAFRAGTLKASAVFEGRALARLMALCDLLGTAAALDWWNLRFVVDSASEQLIPVPLHMTNSAPLSQLLGETGQRDRDERSGGQALIDRALNDPTIEGLYLAYLDTFSAPGWWERSVERTRTQWEPARRAVNAEFPRIDLDLRIVEHDRILIRQALQPHDLVLAYVSDTLEATDGVAIANVHSLPVDVIGVVLTTNDTSKLYTPLRLEPREPGKPLRYAFVPLNVPGSPREVLVRLGPLLETRAVRIRTWSSFGAN